MDTLLIASTEADADAANAVQEHHAQLAGALDLRVEVMLDALSRLDGDAALAARDDLVVWARENLLPHAAAEEKTMYPLARARPDARLLVDAMLTEHAVLTGLVHAIARQTDVVRAAETAGALRGVFHSHVTKENEQLLPLLAAATDVSLDQLLGDMHADLEHGHRETHAQVPAGEHSGGREHTCGCGEVDGPGYPELDARSIPHAIRHATIFGALDALGTAGGLVLVAPHDPLPLLAQVQQRYQGAFGVEYLESGPEVWRLAFVRHAA